MMKRILELKKLAETTQNRRINVEADLLRALFKKIEGEGFFTQGEE